MLCPFLVLGSMSSEMEKDLRALRDNWQNGLAQEALSRQKERKEKFQTDSGIEVENIAESGIIDFKRLTSCWKL